MNKRCKSCDVDKPEGEFYVRRDAPDGRQRECKQCQSAKRKAGRRANPEKETARARAYYRDNKAEVGEKQKAYYQQNRERRQASIRAYNEANKEEQAAYRARWRRENKAKVAETSRRYQARKLKATPEGPADPRVLAVYEIAAWLRERGDDVEVDHIIPLAKGGPHRYENLQILTVAENRKKGAKLPEESDHL